MKKLVMLGFLVMLLGCSSPTQKANMEAYEQLGDDHHYIDKDYETIVKNMHSNKHGIYFVGYSQQEASQDMIRILETVLAETQKEAYYIDSRSESFNDDVQTNYREFINSLPDDNELRVPFIIIIDEKGIYTTSSRLDGVELGKGHISNTAAEAIRAELLNVIQE